MLADNARLLDRKTRIFETNADLFGFIKHAHLLRDVHLEFYKKEKDYWENKA